MMALVIPVLLSCVCEGGFNYKYTALSTYY